MKSSHLFSTPIWLQPTPAVAALSDKSLMIIYQDGSQQPVHIQVCPAHPGSDFEGKISVRVWQTWADDVKFVSVSSGQTPPTSQIHVWEQYLDEFAVEKIIENENKGSYFGSDCLLELSE